MSIAHLNIPSPLQQVAYDPLNKCNITLYIKRDDLIHKSISGNKWRKLKFNMAHARSRGYETILTFGGAHSNHIAATAAAAHGLGVKSIGIIRGKDADLHNYTLSFAIEKGMKIMRVSRSDYLLLQEPQNRDMLQSRYGRVYVIPQGGANFFGAQGCTEIITEITKEIKPDRIFVACGTGTTVSGMAMAGMGKIDLYAVSALKNGGFLLNDIAKILNEIYNDEETEQYIKSKIHLLLEYHFGGYAKTTPELIEFMRSFKRCTGIKLDPVYTAKAVFAMHNLAGKLNEHQPENWVFIHTGGLQGIPAMETKLGYSIY